MPSDPSVKSRCLFVISRPVIVEPEVLSYFWEVRRVFGTDFKVIMETWPFENFERIACASLLSPLLEFPKIPTFSRLTHAGANFTASYRVQRRLQALI